MKLLTFVLSALVLVSQLFLAHGLCDEPNSKGRQFQIPGECAQYTCDGPGAAHGVACPAVTKTVNMECTISENRDMPYPDCCPKFTCKRAGTQNNFFTYQ